MLAYVESPEIYGHARIAFIRASLFNSITSFTDEIALPTFIYSSIIEIFIFSSKNSIPLFYSIFRDCYYKKIHWSISHFYYTIHLFRSENNKIHRRCTRYNVWLYIFNNTIESSNVNNDVRIYTRKHMIHTYIYRAVLTIIKKGDRLRPPIFSSIFGVLYTQDAVVVSMSGYTLLKKMKKSVYTCL